MKMQTMKYQCKISTLAFKDKLLSRLFNNGQLGISKDRISCKVLGQNNTYAEGVPSRRYLED